jgi:hypothetical protein
MAREKEVINIRLDQEEKEIARKIAKDDGRSLSAYIRHLIRIDAKMRGKRRAA